MVAPILAVVALVLFLGKRDEDEVIASTAPPPLIRIPSAAPSGGSEPSPAGAPATEPAAALPPTAGGPVVGVRSGKLIEVFDAPGGNVVAAQGDETEFGSPSVFSVIRRTARWVGVSTPMLPNGQLGWIRADAAKLVAGYVDYSVDVDLSERSARLFQGEALLRAWPVTVGMAGSETPTGRFAITDTFSGGLNDAYGCCAVALSATQPNLPLGWPGGNRIAFHGTSGPLGIAASHGCLRSADDDVSALINTAPLGTPVRIHE